MESLRAKVGSNALAAVAANTAGTFPQILRELLQNARRSTTDRIDIDIRGRWIEITDYGHGILNPDALLEYGTPIWTPQVLDEEPAGTGLFALANSEARISTRPAASDTGEHGQPWSVLLAPEHFRGSPARPVRSDDAPEPHGTKVSFAVEQVKEWWVESQVAHFPVPVRINGREVERTPIAEGADESIEWNGIRIGLFDGRAGREKRSQLNYHGAVVPLHVRTVEGAPYAMADVVDCARLRLERPGLESVEDDDFSQRLHETIVERLAERRDVGRRR